MAFGHSLSAREIGIAERTPNFRASYDAEQTTPRLSRVPPTMSSGSFPAPSGSTILATATKKASASASRIRRLLTPLSPDVQILPEVRALGIARDAQRARHDLS